MKKLLFSLIALVSISALGQGFSLSTNVWFTNTIAASATLTYTGTNYLDVSRFKTFALVATGAGTNTSTNTLTFTFKASPTGTNWEVVPSYTLTGTIHGTNPFYLFTHVSCGDGVAYVTAYKIINSATNAITNAWVYGPVKTFPRN